MNKVNKPNVESDNILMFISKECLLSAYMDGDKSFKTPVFSITDIYQDKVLLDKWMHYHWISSLIKGDYKAVNLSLVERIQKALKDNEISPWDEHDNDSDILHTSNPNDALNNALDWKSI